MNEWLYGYMVIRLHITTHSLLHDIARTGIDYCGNQTDKRLPVLSVHYLRAR